MNRLLVRLIAALQVIGGSLLVVYVVSDLLPSMLNRSPESAVRLGQSLKFGAPMLAGFALAVLAGVQLWRGRRIGVVLSIGVQALLLPWLSLPGFTYQMDIGAYLVVKVALVSAFVVRVHAELDWPSALIIFDGPSSPEVGINLLALGCLVVLMRAYVAGNVDATLPRAARRAH